jgi:hypothetical protein
MYKRAERGPPPQSSGFCKKKALPVKAAPLFHENDQPELIYEHGCDGPVSLPVPG